MSSLVNAMVDLDWFSRVDATQSDDVNQHIDGFSEAYGSRTDVKLKCKPVKGSQKLSISGGKLGTT